MAGDRDLTPGELGIKLDGVSEQLRQIRTEMFTTSLFSAWRDGNEARMNRIEADQKEWARLSTQAHEQLNGAILAAIATDKAEREKLEVVIRGEIKAVADELEKAMAEQVTIKKMQENRRYDLVKAVGLALLVSILGVISGLVVTYLRGG